MDAAILFSVILVVPHGLGQQVGFKDGEGPVLEPIRDARDLRHLDPSRQGDILAPVYDAVRRVAAALPAETALIGFAGAPWTVATYVVEGGSSRNFDHARKWAPTNPIAF